MNKVTRDSRSVVYVNFTPYENAGSILDYLKNSFETVILFSFNFHRVSQRQYPSSITIFREGRVVKKQSIFQIPVTSTYAFVLLPIRSLVIFIELTYYLLQLKQQIPTYDIFFTVNGFVAWAGIVLKRFSIVKRTVFWVWDYYPQSHENIAVHIMRKLYWQFDRVAIHSDRVVFLTNRLLQLHTQVNDLDPKKYSVVGIGTEPHKAFGKRINHGITLSFLGTIKISQGLDMIFDCSDALVNKFKKVRLCVFGGGPDEIYFQKRADKSGLKTKFFGYIPENNYLQKSLNRTDIGIALYTPDPGNVSYYGDPSKIKAYLSESLPVIATDTFEFSKEIKRYKAGIIIEYNNKNQLLRAIQTIEDNYFFYSKNAYALAAKYTYQALYIKLFEEDSRF